VYAGFGIEDYGWSANKPSPLHKTDRNYSVFAGITYTLNESKKKSVPVESTRGIFNKMRAL
jgi:hypothetical protein